MFALLSHLTELTKSNPIVAGAVSLWGLSVVTIASRNVPMQLWKFCKGQLTTTVTFNNTGWWGNRELFASFNEWYKTNKGAQMSRSLSLDARDSGGIIIGPGYGLHVFIADHRLFWFTKATIEGPADSGIKQLVELSTFGRSRKPLETLIKRFEPKLADDNLTHVYGISKDTAWDLSASVVKRPLESVVLPAAVKDLIISQLDQFYAMREWYLSKGLAHKLCTVLQGKPGCGKTSLVKALAARYGANIYTLALNDTSDRSLPILLSKVPKGSFVLIEDFDTFSAVKSRTKGKAAVSSSEASMMEAMMSPLTLSGVLNALDGVASLDNVVIFMNTNHPEDIDPAVLRKGRTDLIVELKELNNDEVHEYVRYVYGRQVSATFRPVAGCDLQGVLLEYKQDFDGFIAALIERYAVHQSGGALRAIGH